MKLNLAYDNQIGFSDLGSDKSTLINQLGVSKEDAEKLASIKIDNGYTVDTTSFAKDIIPMFRELRQKLKPRWIRVFFGSICDCDSIYFYVMVKGYRKLDCDLTLLYGESNTESKKFEFVYNLSMYKEFASIISKYVGCRISVYNPR